MKVDQGGRVAKAETCRQCFDIAKIKLPEHVHEVTAEEHARTLETVQPYGRN